MVNAECGGEVTMRTTLTIAGDVLAAARAIAQHTNRTIGQTPSDLARTALRSNMQSRERNGIPLLPVRNPYAVVTPEIVNALCDDRCGVHVIDGTAGSRPGPERLDR